LTQPRQMSRSKCHGQRMDTNRLGKPVTASVTARIPVLMVTQAKKRASRAGVSFSQILSTALARYLAQK
jgi:predicted DNA binding CopG/RHH family protein